MNYKNIKIHTFVNLFGVVVISMLLINVVVLIFWYEHLAKQQEKSATLLLNQYFAGQNIQDLENADHSVFFQSLIGNDSNGIIKIIFQNIEYKKAGSTLLSGVQVDNTIVSKQSLMSHLDSDNHSSSLLKTSRNKAYNLPTENGELIGFTLDTSSIASQIWGKQKVIFLYIIFNALVLTTILFFRFRKTLFAPMDNLLNIANNYQLDEGLWAIQSTSGGDFDQLSQAMNAMVHRIEEDRDKLLKSLAELKTVNRELRESQQETMQAEKLASTGRLAAGFAHEIGNPLAIIQGYLELLKQSNYTPEEQKEFVSRSLNELHRIDSLLFQLMDMAKVKPKNEEEVNVCSICSDLVQTLEKTAAKSNTSFVLQDNSGNGSVFCDPEQLRQVLLNFFLNGIDAIRDKGGLNKGEIRCDIDTQQISKKKFIVIKIRDNGAGIKKENLQKLFEPFFTTKPVGQGTGLGLSVAYRIIDSLGGNIQVESTEGKGTTFTLFLPLYQKDKIDE